MPPSAQIEKARTSARRGTSRIDEPAAYHAEGVLYLTPSARFDYLLQRPEGSNVGRAVNEAMADTEKHNPQLAGVLPRNYQIFNGTLLKELLKKVSEIPVSLDYDAFGRIYEYFLGEFARTEGQKGGERWGAIDEWKKDYTHPLWTAVGELARKNGGHGGMDFVMAYRLVQCLREGLAPDYDVYDAAAWSAPFPLSEMSVAKGSAPMKFPDFTRGAWDKVKA